MSLGSTAEPGGGIGLVPGRGISSIAGMSSLAIRSVLTSQNFLKKAVSAAFIWSGEDLNVTTFLAGSFGMKILTDRLEPDFIVTEN